MSSLDSIFLAADKLVDLSTEISNAADDDAPPDAAELRKWSAQLDEQIAALVRVYKKEKIYDP